MSEGIVRSCPSSLRLSHKLCRWEGRNQINTWVRIDLRGVNSSHVLVRAVKQRCAYWHRPDKFNIFIFLAWKNTAWGRTSFDKRHEKGVFNLEFVPFFLKVLPERCKTLFVLYCSNRHLYENMHFVKIYFVRITLVSEHSSFQLLLRKLLQS